MSAGNGYVDFLPSLTSVQSPSLASRSAVRESCREPKRGISCAYGPASASRDTRQRVPAPALVLSSSVLNRRGRTAGVERPASFGEAGRAHGHGRGSSQLLWLFGWSHDFIIEGHMKMLLQR